MGCQCHRHQKAALAVAAVPGLRLRLRLRLQPGSQLQLQSIFFCKTPTHLSMLASPPHHEAISLLGQPQPLVCKDLWAAWSCMPAWSNQPLVFHLAPGSHASKLPPLINITSTSKLPNFQCDIARCATCHHQRAQFWFNCPAPRWRAPGRSSVLCTHPFDCTNSPNSFFRAYILKSHFSGSWRQSRCVNASSICNVWASKCLRSGHTGQRNTL